MQLHSRSTLRGLHAFTPEAPRSRTTLFKTAAFGLCLLPFAGGVSHAQTVLLQENFSGGFPADWYQVVHTASPGLVSVSNETLVWSFRRPAVVTDFSPVTLQNAGDYIQASFDVRYTINPGAVTTGASLALYNSQGTYITENSVGASQGSVPAVATDDKGYKVYKAFGVGGVAATANDFALFSNSRFSQHRFGAEGNTEIAGHVTGGGVALNTTYGISLNIERQANSDLLITYSFGALSHSHTVAAASVLTYTFDEIGINLFAGDNPGSGFLDNVLVVSGSSIPEPSSYALLLGGFAALAAAGRRRSKK